MRAPDRQLEAVAAARAALKPAVAAGMFSSNPPKRVPKFLLKFAMTSFKNHDGQAWGETAFEYDDERAPPVIAKAVAGNAQARDLLLEIARTRLRNLPPNLAGYVDRLLASKPVRRRRGAPRKFFDRDVAIYYVAQKLGHRFNLKPTRNDATAEHSISSAISTALADLGVAMDEKTVAKIYQKIHRSIPANSVRNK